jgi:plastocyanin
VIFKKSIVVAVLVIAASLLGAGTFKYSQNKTDTASKIGSNTVELRKDGFYPSVLTIKLGQTVKFTSGLNRPFWPASNEHPSHSIYPEFDPKAPIDPSLSWSFTFDKIGTWRYHDHLSPALTGTIVVTGGEGQKSVSACQKDEHTRDCWQEQVNSKLETQGLDAAFNLIEDLYKRETSFAAECHDITHNMGHLAYKLYLKDRYSVLSAKSAYCANGFYHGFMEGVLDATLNVKEAHDFCALVKQKLSIEAPDAELQCYHGIGHGSIAVTMGKQKTYDEESIIKPALALCEKASDNDLQLYRCASGVFNGIANFYIKGDYSLKVNQKDPLWFCREQAVKYQESCYGNMNATIYWLTGNDFLKAAKFVEAITDDKQAKKTMEYLAALATLTTAKNNHAKAVTSCRLVEKRLVQTCIEGFAHGFLENGMPNLEYQEALDFCRDKAMTSEESLICIKYTLSSLNGWYPKSKTKEICSQIEADYKKYCPPA